MDGRIGANGLRCGAHSADGHRRFGSEAAQIGSRAQAGVDNGRVVARWICSALPFTRWINELIREAPERANASRGCSIEVCPRPRALNERVVRYSADPPHPPAGGRPGRGARRTVLDIRGRVPLKRARGLPRHGVWISVARAESRGFCLFSHLPAVWLRARKSRGRRVPACR